MSKSGRPSILTRRWVWWTVAIAAVFLVGVAAGAGKATYNRNTCEAAGLSAAAPISPGVGGV